MIDDLKNRLSEEEYHVTQEKGTERPFANAYWDHHDSGMYVCKVCGAELFDSNVKYDSGTGWPSFSDALPGAIKTEIDSSLGIARTEIVCVKCGAHLGHVFSDGPKNLPDGTPATGKRFCTNSASLQFHKK